MCEAELARGRGQMMRWEEEDFVGPLGPREQAVVPERHTTKPHSVPVLQNSTQSPLRI